ncbi:hypothetical protein PAUR_a3055 [Pseudoalteromonas aurantia 208]|uniref:Uncharacterized protein n=1 Tax=Pseudoalteromonas aurantia 208 TaxID=1314867 RepID=A0ABR9EE27_9GAMM|nr:hypothetical protein [Pseudoalteromonas aurantia 208]
MTTNGMLAYAGSIIIYLQFIVFFTFIILSYENAKVLLFGGSKDISSEHDAFIHSCFLSVLTVVVFHFTTSSIRELILTIDMNMERLELRQFFYFMMFVLEFAAILCLFFLHRLRKCKFSIIAKMVVSLAVILCMNFVIQYYYRALNDVESYTPIFKTVTVAVNILTLICIGLVPLANLKKLRLGS